MPVPVIIPIVVGQVSPWVAGVYVATAGVMTAFAGKLIAEEVDLRGILDSAGEATDFIKHTLLTMGDKEAVRENMFKVIGAKIEGYNTKIDILFEEREALNLIKNPHLVKEFNEFNDDIAHYNAALSACRLLEYELEESEDIVDFFVEMEADIRDLKRKSRDYDEDVRLNLYIELYNGR